MGYTHYWEVKEDLDQDTWDEFIKDCKYLYKNIPEYSKSAGGYYADTPLYLSGCFRYKYPRLDKDKIYFNGSAIPPKKRIKKDEKLWKDDEMHHETFVLKRIRSSEFCKTARKPYDLMVITCLILLQHYFEDKVEVLSDGGYPDWIEGYKFIAEKLPNGKSKILDVLI